MVHLVGRLCPSQQRAHRVAQPGALFLHMLSRAVGRDRRNSGDGESEKGGVGKGSGWRRQEQQRSAEQRGGRKSVQLNGGGHDSSRPREHALPPACSRRGGKGMRACRRVQKRRAGGLGAPPRLPRRSSRPERNPLRSLRGRPCLGDPALRESQTLGRLLFPSAFADAESPSAGIRALDGPESRPPWWQHARPQQPAAGAAASSSSRSNRADNRHHAARTSK